MARKRGGIAGFYDRNKGVIKTVAPIAAGFIPGVGPLVGAALGAALGGDREGKGYFGGFDVGGAVKGGLSGYGGAKLGQAAKGGLAKMFTGGVSPVDKLTGAPSVGLTPGAPTSYGSVGSMAPDVGGTAAAAMPGPAASSSMYGNIPAPRMAVQPKIATQVADPIRNPVVKAAGSIAKKAGSALNNKEGLAFAGNALQTGASIMGSQAQAAQQEREYEDEQRQLQARAEMLALFAPQMAGNLGMTNFMPQAAGIGASGRGNAAMTMQDYMGASGANATPEEFGPEMMEYVNSRRGPVRPSGPNPELMDYINSRRGRPAGPSQGLMNYVNSRR